MKPRYEVIEEGGGRCPEVVQLEMVGGEPRLKVAPRLNLGSKLSDASNRVYSSAHSRLFERDRRRGASRLDVPTRTGLKELFQ